MSYTKTITITEPMDMYLQSELQRLKQEVFEPVDGQIGNVAQQLLSILESAPVADLV